MDTTKLWETYYTSIKKQDWKKALAALKSLSELKKKDPQVHLKMGDLLQRLSINEGAIASYHAAGKILMKEGFQQKAIAIYKIILRLDPKDKEATRRLQAILTEMESSKQGIQFPAFAQPKAEETPQPPEQAPQPEEVQAPQPEEVVEHTAWETPQPQPLPEPPKEEPVSWEAPEEAAPARWPESPPESLEEEAPSEAEEKPAEWEMPPEMPPSAPLPEREKGGEVVSWESLEELLGELETAPWETLKEGPPVRKPQQAEAEKQEVPALFSSLTRQEALSVLRKAEQRTYEDGQTVVEEGDTGDSMFIVKKGRVKVIAHILGKTVELASLKEGDFFGEVAFLTGRPRTASVVADGQAQVLEIGRPLIEEVIDKNPQVLEKLQDFYQSRVKQTITKIKGGIE